MPILVLLACTALLVAAETPTPGAEPVWTLPEGVPPSPSTAPGVRIWPEPRFSHWPAVIYRDETRNASFEIPVKQAGVPGWIGWIGQDRLPFVLPEQTDRSSGLIDLPKTLGLHQAEVGIGEEVFPLALRLSDAREPWPFHHLVGGFPVDADGVPVVLLDQRRDPATERQWRLLAQDLPRGSSRALVVGDPLEALGDSLFTDLDARCVVATDDRRSDHAVLVALAGSLDPVPRSLIWSPGNANLFFGTWSGEEERVFGAIRSRLTALGAQPRCAVLLPPIPVDVELRALAEERRSLLARSAAFQGWQVLDAETIAGPAETANRMADGLFTRHPIGDARERIRNALVAELAR